MTIYVLLGLYYDECHVKGVFTDKALAERAKVEAEERNNNRPSYDQDQFFEIEEYEANKLY